MSRVKTWAIGVILVSGISVQANDRNELSEIIATCAGRMSAELEFAWLFSDPDADLLEEQRRRFMEILDSIGPSANPQQLAFRIDAKMAHATLLTAAFFGTDTARATWAKRRAETQRAACQNMLLDS
jgi:uncharacterized protein (UPF0303 family)